MKAILLSLMFLACTTSDGVYICTGPQSRRYHKSASCKGLRNCSREIKKSVSNKQKVCTKPHVTFAIDTIDNNGIMKVIK